MVPVVKNPPINAGDIRDAGSIPGLGRSPGGKHGNPLQYSCMENALDRGAWWATVHRVAKSRTLLKWLSMHTHEVGHDFSHIISQLMCVYVHTYMYIFYVYMYTFMYTYMYIFYVYIKYIYILCVLYIYGYMDINVCYTHTHVYAYTYSMFFISPHRRMPLLATCYFDLWIFFGLCCPCPRVYWNLVQVHSPSQAHLSPPLAKALSSEVCSSASGL